MATIATTRTKLQAAIDDISSLHVHSVWPNQIAQLPAFVLMPAALSTKQSMGGRRVMTFEGILIGGSADTDPKRAQDKLDTYLNESGGSSIIAKLEADKTLEGTVSSLEVSWRDYADRMPINGVDYLTVTFDITVWP